MILECIALLILSVLGIWLTYWFLRVWHFERYLKGIPHPPLIPLVGNAMEFASSITILSTVMKYHRKYKGNFKIYVGSQPFLFFSETKDIAFILTSTTMLRKSDPYRFLHNWLGTGLLTSWGDKWRKHRKIITPAFHFQILEESVDVFNSAGNILITKLTEESKKGSIDVYPFVARCTLDIICETAMGTTVDAQNDPNSQYMDSVNVLLGVLVDRTLSPLLGNDLLYRFSRTYQREQQALKVVHGYSKSVINKKMEEFERTRVKEESSVDNLGIKKKKALLDLLLEYAAKDPAFNFEDICQEVDTFMFEGHDTTATSISFALFSLAANPEVQETAFAEQKEIFITDMQRPAAFEDLKKMLYLKMVIMESLRTYTTIPVYARAIDEVVDWNDVLIPKHTVVNLNAYALHHDPNVYPNPEKFDPERFNSDTLGTNNPFVFVPFSAGPRNCIGQKFAMLQMQCILSIILRSFEIRPAVPEHKIIFRTEAVLKSDNGVVVKLVKRH
ncbi:cytochrome P450 [Oryctes borbonicus]|uniref:Cytochrome P450 n=1 Tax=Oryctes borbonicus TaxID=1629725 RepID=A0A0T6AW61_9SCAR|nr:cytochrome P450 [Oryctes borbonicus]